MTTTADLVALIAPEHAGKPKFAATVALSVDPLVRMEAALQALYFDFDLDVAVGPQLDAVGVRVGRSRAVPIPLQNLFFSWDDTIRGWDAGIWKGPYDVGTTIFNLDDDTYRRLLRAKVLANRWDGTVSSLEAIYTAFFDDPATLVFVSDDSYSAQPQEFFTWDDANRGWDRGSWIAAGETLNAPSIGSVDMRITVGFAGRVPPIIDLAILDQGLVGAKPEGVAVALAVTSVVDAPIFGFDLQSEYIGGWDTGAWAATPAELIANPPQTLAAAAAVSIASLDFRFAMNSGLLPLL